MLEPIAVGITWCTLSISEMDVFQCTLNLENQYTLSNINLNICCRKCFELIISVTNRRSMMNAFCDNMNPFSTPSTWTPRNNFTSPKSFNFKGGVYDYHTCS